MAPVDRQNTAKLKKTTASLREHARNRRLARFLFAFVVVVAAFILGFALRSNVPLVTALGFPVPEVSEGDAKAASSKSTYDALSARVGEVEDILSTLSMDEADLRAATEGMLSELMASTGDPYAAYYDEERYESYIKESADKDYSGIGVLFGDYNGRAYAIDVLQGSEAEARGVEKGDFVVSIDGDSSHPWSATEVIGAIARDEGSSVIVTWMRPISMDAERGTEFTTTLVCSAYKAENVTTDLFEEVGYIRLHQITGNASNLVSDAVSRLGEEGAKAFILDVRDNPGGYLTQACDIASLFIQSGVLVGIQTNDGTSTRTSTGITITDAPLVLLVNGYTAASAEVLTAALQDNQRATTVGQNTMGKGSVQVMRELSFGGAVRYTAAFYLTPLGHEINMVGIAPDISVGAGMVEGEDDTQLLVAIDTARSLVG